MTENEDRMINYIPSPFHHAANMDPNDLTKLRKNWPKLRQLEKDLDWASTDEITDEWEKPEEPEPLVPEQFKRRFREAMSQFRGVHVASPPGFGKSAMVAKLLEEARVWKCDLLDPVSPLPDRQDGSWQVLLVDQLQWGKDPQFQKRLRQLIIGATGDHRVVMLSQAPLPGWLQPLHLTGLLGSFTTEDLLIDEETIQQMLEAAGVEAKPALVQQLAEKSHGNLRYIRSMVRLFQKNFSPKEDMVWKQGWLNLHCHYKQAIIHYHTSYRQLLLELGPFNNFDAELARIITGDPNAGQQLEYLRANSCIFLPEEEPGIYRFHPVIRHFLAIWSLDFVRIDAIPGLMRRACLYYEIKEDYDHAIECCWNRMNMDTPTIVRLLIRHAERFPGVEDYLALEKEYRRLPPGVAENYPELMYAMCVICAAHLEIEQAEHWYEMLRKATAKTPGPSEGRGRVALLDISLPHRDPEKMAEQILQTYKRLCSKDILLPTCSVTGAMPSVLNGVRDLSPWSTQMDELYQTLRLPAETMLGREGIGLGDCALAECKFEQGQDIRDYMMALLDQVPNICRNGSTDTLFVIAGLLARLQASQGRAQEAKKTLLQFREYVLRLHRPVYLIHLDSLVCQMDLRLGNDLEVEQWYREKAPANIQPPRLNRMSPWLTQAMAELSSGQDRQALETLLPLEAAWNKWSRVINVIHLNVMAAIALYRLDDNSWQGRLELALMLASQCGYSRTIGQYGAGVLPLLQRSSFRYNPAFFQEVMAQARAAANQYPEYLRARGQVDIALTTAEYQVLQLLCRNMTNAQIGQILGIKLPTVKTHVSHILTKIGVERRQEVPDAARRLRLVP